MEGVGEAEGVGKADGAAEGVAFGEAVGNEEGFGEAAVLPAGAVVVGVSFLHPTDSTRHPASSVTSSESFITFLLSK